MTREEAFNDINNVQEYYVSQLIEIIENNNTPLKFINFTSPTGTGKTKMMSMIINHYPNYYFIVTTLSKGQLNIQTSTFFKKDCLYNNYYVYGTSDYKINSILEAEDIINRIPKDSPCIWLRDEGHIATNRFDEILIDKCFKNEFNNEIM